MSHVVTITFIRYTGILLVQCMYYIDYSPCMVKFVVAEFII